MLNLVEHYTTHIKPNGYKAMIVATSREAAVTYKKYLDRIGAPKSKIIMTSRLGEKGKDGHYVLRSVEDLIISRIQMTQPRF